MSPPALPRKEAVGYGRPPLHSRFKPGRSGNPRGRPKGSKNIATILSALLSERVAGTENGRRVKRTKLELILLQLVHRAAKGDLKATALLLKLQGFGEMKAEEALPEQPFGGKDDEKLLDDILSEYGVKPPASEDDDGAR